MNSATDEMSIEPASIVFLDDNDDLRELMPRLLEFELGVNCLTFARLMELEQHMEEVLRAKVAILDINLGPNEPDGVEAFHWLMAHGFQGKVLFFTGHARANPRVALAEESGVEVLEKPLQPDKLMSTIARALDDRK
jgi:DNA-binding NtrC family response regulator